MIFFRGEEETSGIEGARVVLSYGNSDRKRNKCRVAAFSEYMVIMLWKCLMGKMPSCVRPGHSTDDKVGHRTIKDSWNLEQKCLNRDDEFEVERIHALQRGINMLRAGLSITIL